MAISQDNNDCQPVKDLSILVRLIELTFARPIALLKIEQVRKNTSSEYELILLNFYVSMRQLFQLLDRMETKGCLS
jgi:hypothetical protein